MMEIKQIYAFDAEGFFSGIVDFQVGDGIYKPDDCTETPPPSTAVTENFYQWDGNKWKTVPKPKTAEELEGIVISHKSMTPHDLEMRRLMLELTTGSKTHRYVRGDDLSHMVVKITDEEKDAETAEKDLAAFDSELSSLKDRMSLAMLMGNEEQIESLRAEYQSLMSTGTFEEETE